jgi:hypothetical protein
LNEFTLLIAGARLFSAIAEYVMNEGPMNATKVPGARFDLEADFLQGFYSDTIR